jgi:hypothetical protein
MQTKIHICFKSASMALPNPPTDSIHHRNPKTFFQDFLYSSGAKEEKIPSADLGDKSGKYTNLQLRPLDLDMALITSLVP